MSTYMVTNLGDTGQGFGLQGDLRYTINAANANSDLSNQIIFQTGLNGTITLVQGKLVVTKALALLGPGADALTVSGNHQSGVFDIEAPAGQTVILSDLTIADGTGAGEYLTFPVGGGLFNNVATLVLIRTTFSRNTLPREPSNGNIGGAAIFNFHGTVTLNAALITNNHADLGTGVAIENLGTMDIHESTVSGNSGLALQSVIGNPGTMTLENSVISDNSGDITNDGAITLIRCNLSRNTSPFGGALYGAGTITITDSTITDNVAAPTGGAMFVGGQVTILRSTISGNRATYGGGIFFEGGHLTVTDSTISGNTAARQGGGILIGGVQGDDGIAEITASTITANVTTENAFDWGGGGIYTDLRTLIDSTIIAANRTARQGPDVNGSVISLGYNLIGATDASDGWTSTDRTGTSANPLDPLLGPLQDNGGPTLTHALLVGSPALGGGDQAVGNLPDQRGSARLYPNYDIGAFQTEPATQFVLVAPAQVNALEPFSVTVTALDAWGNTASSYTGTVHFSSTDLFAQLPDDVTFSGDDGGAHTVSVILNTPGIQELQAVDSHAGSIEGSANVAVANTFDAWEFAALVRSAAAQGSGATASAKYHREFWG